MCGSCIYRDDDFPARLEVLLCSPRSLTYGLVPDFYKTVVCRSDIPHDAFQDSLRVFIQDTLFSTFGQEEILAQGAFRSFRDIDTIL